LGLKSGGNVLVEEKENLAEEVVCVHVYQGKNEAFD
jgi:hypothetical protein